MTITKQMLIDAGASQGVVDSLDAYPSAFEIVIKCSDCAYEKYLCDCAVISECKSFVTKDIYATFQ